MNTPRSDRDLVLAAQRGDKRAFVEIVARYQSMVYGVALGILGDFAASEDVAQDAFVSAWKKMADLREPEKLRAWLGRIARNGALGHRRNPREAEAWVGPECSEMDEQPAPDEQAAHEEEAVLVRESLARLPESFRLPLVMYYCQDQSIQEVAATLNLSEDAVRKRISRGRELLRDRISGLIEITLRRARPGAIFTISVAAAIGALATPAALASGAFAAAASMASASSATTAAPASAVTTTTATTPVVTAMTTSQSTSLVAALAAAACFPLGYAVHSGLDAPVTAAVAVPVVAASQPEASPPDFSGSELFAEWIRLHNEHGHDAAAMPALFHAISNIKDTFRRRAFRAALTEEWTEVDPAGGLAFFLGEGGNREASRQLFRAWLAEDPASALAELTRLGASGEALAGDADVLMDIARRAPDHIPSIAARLPKNTDHWRHPVTDAFAVLADRDLESARRSAEELTGARREEALAGVAKSWAAKDFDAAAAWVRSLPGGTDHEGILRQALMGLAANDPGAALAKADIVPPGGRSGYFADTTAARLLKQTKDEDFETVAAWLRDHPGKISSEDVVGLSSIVTQRLNEDPGGFLERMTEQGTFGALGAAIHSALLNDAKPQLEAVWEWLKSQPESEATRGLRESVLNSAGWQNPELAYSIAQAAPDTAAGRQELQRIASSLLNGGQRLNRIDALLAGAPDNLRHPLLVAAFQSMNPDGLGSPDSWLPRLNELPTLNRPTAAAQLAGAWAYRDPEAAAAWATQLPADAGRLDSVRTVAGTWLGRDSLAASEWIAQLPAGAERDAGAGVLVQAMARESTHEAWQWALSISDPRARLDAAQTALTAMAQRDSAEALHWIESSGLPAQEKASLIEGVAAAAPSNQPR